MYFLSKKDSTTALEIFAVFHFVYCTLFFQLLVITIILYLLFTPYWFFTVLIFTWLAFDWKAPERGGRRVSWVRRWQLWKQYCNYFPLKVVKTHDIPPSHNYIMVYHPHGLLAHSCFGHFVTDNSGFQKLFPGITLYLLTLGAFFWLPFFRDYVMSTGICSVSRSSIDFLLTHKGTGNMLIVVPGGLAECEYSIPGSFTLFLKNRSGFVNKALQHGAALIPTYAFGETDLYDQHIFPPGGLVNRFQKLFQRLTYIYPCAFYGRGFTENSWGFLPYARPVTTIVGKPILVPKIEQPSKEIVAQYHSLYIDALKKLFDEHKTKYGISETQELVID